MNSSTIKLISLNVWGGRSLYPLMKFFRQWSSHIDIFCLQEVFDTDQAGVDELHPEEYVCGPLFTKLSAALPDFNGWCASFEDNPHRLTLAMFIRKTVQAKAIADFVVFEPESPKEHGSFVISSRKLQYATIMTPSGKCLVCNFHGLWTGGSKTDTPERIAQSQEIKIFLDGFSSPKILCGDFNLLPGTQSMQILESGMRNLVQEANVASTRTPLYRNFDDPAEPNFADYILVSPDINVHEFKVLPDIASDHSPLYMEFSV